MEGSAHDVHEASLLRKSKANAALICHIDIKKLEVRKEEFLEDTTLEEIVEELPDADARFIVLSYELHHDDGRVSYPIVGINYCHPASGDQVRVTSAACRSRFFQEAEVSGKVFELEEPEDLTKENLEKWILSSKTRP
ncbi:hypothetical protein BJ742DRAFT_27464 [Cladochytrium replicatum]|nr:hypothetical protein BJ742DRAFT_27464 [Cladochytrium replicatum]